MQTLYYPEFKKLVVTDRPVPVPAADEVLIEVRACGICGSELESFASQSSKRTPPIVMGHEFCGRVAALGAEVEEWEVGDHVLTNAIISCGVCRYCEQRQTNLCLDRKVYSIHRDGAFAEYVTAKANLLIALSEEIPDVEACMTEPLANGVHMVSLTKHLACKQVLVIGAGPIGLMALQAFRALRGANCFVSDLNVSRLEVAKRLGAAAVINPKENDVFDFMEAHAPQGIDLVVDAVGNKYTTKQALQIVRPGGAVVLIGLQQNTDVISSYELITKEKQVIGSYGATEEDMTVALGLIEDKKVDVTSWVNYYSLDQGVEGFLKALKGENIKTVLKIKGDAEMNSAGRI